MKKFQFNLYDKVMLAKSGEKGEVIGVAEYSRRPPSFLVEYVAADGRQVDAWFDAEALQNVLADRAVRGA
ncbi:hypothetical protein [Ciceribacter ferrooxidans]|uniref:DUF4926 domain-containing protein n=1 Tax=Ciceribacter ferrooxidans TaxID=2509717 RepID=A0A4Q2SVE7_9HYPH|nr:hypothetical protein [Ciceribacter ferrooxidans]RYC10046.1 hypothetical protein EUU22_18390 [Ciceribacter ferrooxidans]